MTISGTSSIKRTRRTKREMEALCDRLYTVVAENRPATVRQVFYRMVSLGAIQKLETEYSNVVSRLLTRMRRKGRIPYGWIADHTRWIRQPPLYDSMEEALFQTASLYRRNLWRDQDAYVEVWCEKDALAGVLYDKTALWGVPLMVVRGYPSHSYLYQVAEHTREMGKPTVIYYFGDHDPSGVDAQRFAEKELRHHAADLPIEFHRVAVTPEQIVEWKLPTRPTKKTDSRSRRFKGESVELDAIPPATLRQLVEDSIRRHVDPHAHRITQEAERSERELLAGLAENLA